MILCNLHSKVTFISISKHFSAHILQQERNNKEQKSCLKQQKDKFCIMIKSQYLTTAKAVHNECHHTVRKTEYNTERLREAFSRLDKM